MIDASLEDRQAAPLVTRQANTLPANRRMMASRRHSLVIAHKRSGGISGAGRSTVASMSNRFPPTSGSRPTDRLRLPGQPPIPRPPASIDQ
jgi:hypothetical protein